jgi:hypothetical protein
MVTSAMILMMCFIFSAPDGDLDITLSLHSFVVCSLTIWGAVTLSGAVVPFVDRRSLFVDNSMLNDLRFNLSSILDMH